MDATTKEDPLPSSLASGQLPPRFDSPASLWTRARAVGHLLSLAGSVYFIEGRSRDGSSAMLARRLV